MRDYPRFQLNLQQTLQASADSVTVDPVISTRIKLARTWCALIIYMDTVDKL